MTFCSKEDFIQLNVQIINREDFITTKGSKSVVYKLLLGEGFTPQILIRQIKDNKNIQNSIIDEDLYILLEVIEGTNKTIDLEFVESIKNLGSGRLFNDILDPDTPQRISSDILGVKSLCTISIQRKEDDSISLVTNDKVSVQLALCYLHFFNGPLYFKMLNLYIAENIDDGIEISHAGGTKELQMVRTSIGMSLAHLSAIGLFKSYSDNMPTHKKIFKDKRLQALGALLKLQIKPIEGLESFLTSISNGISNFPNLKKFIYNFLVKCKTDASRHTLLLMKNNGISSLLITHEFLYAEHTMAHRDPIVMEQLLKVKTFVAKLKQLPEWEYINFHNPSFITLMRDDYKEAAYCGIKIRQTEGSTFANFALGKTDRQSYLDGLLSKKVVTKTFISEEVHNLHRELYNKDMVIEDERPILDQNTIQEAMLEMFRRK